MNTANRPCELTILMPCLNEAATLSACIREANGFLIRNSVCGEVLIADNGSTDGSQAIASSLGARVVSISMRGYGAALLGGIRAARGRYVIMGDSDGSYDFSSIDSFLTELRQGSQLVMGNRFQGGIAPGAMPVLHHYLGNPVLSAIGRALYGSPVGDFHCGLRGFDRNAILDLDLHLPGMEFSSEMVVKATIHKLQITEVATTLGKDGRSRRPHLRSWRDGWRHLRFLLLLSPRWLFLYSGMTSLAVGLAAMGILLTGPVRLDGVRFDIHTLFYSSLLVVIGYQFVLFWVSCMTLSLTMGIVEPGPWFRRLHRALTLERGLSLALVLLLTGLGLGFQASVGWGKSGFGELLPDRTMRQVIPSGTCIMLAVSTASMTSFLSFVGFALRSAADRRAEE